MESLPSGVAQTTPTTTADNARLPGLAVTLRQALRHPASWVFGAVWLIAVLCLVVTGNGGLLSFALGTGVFAALLALGSVALTSGAAPAQRPVAASSGRLGAQFVVIAVVVALSLCEAPLFALFLRAHPQMLHHISLTTLSVLTYSVANPLVYFVLPTLLLGALGVRLREFNLGKGWRSWRVILLWAPPLLVIMAGALLFTSARHLLALIPLSLAANALQNGFFEEFLWRGVVMSRLRVLWGNGWSIVLSSLLFGLWHTLAELATVHGNPLAAMALPLVSLAPVGLAFAIVTYRTRNLLASSVIHVLWDTVFELI